MGHMPKTVHILASPPHHSCLKINLMPLHSFLCLNSTCRYFFVKCLLKFFHETKFAITFFTCVSSLQTMTIILYAILYGTPRSAFYKLHIHAGEYCYSNSLQFTMRCNLYYVINTDVQYMGKND